MKNVFIVKHTTCKTWSRRRVRYKRLGRLVVGGSALRIGCPVCGAHILLQSPALPDVHLTLKSLGLTARLRCYCRQEKQEREGKCPRLQPSQCQAFPTVPGNGRAGSRILKKPNNHVASGHAFFLSRTTVPSGLGLSLLIQTVAQIHQ